MRLRSGCRRVAGPQGSGVSECKSTLIDKVVEEVTAIRKRAQEYEDNPDLVRGII